MGTTPAKKPWFLSRESSSNSGFWKSRKSGYTASNYWLKDSIFDRQTTIFTSPTPVDSSSKFDYYQLGKYQRAISNFVRIMTGRSDIRVKYAERGKESHTDGKTITLSTNIKDAEFDAAVGLALHESSHIVYTDFNAWQSYCNSAYTGANASTGKYKKMLLNLVEDLYIDAMTYKTSPGYRGYYSALYQKFFGDTKIVRGMYSPEYMMPSWDNYMFHLINIRNPQRNLAALPGLEDMFNMLDMPNITRLNTFKQRIELADALYDEIQKYSKAFSEVKSSINESKGSASSEEISIDDLNEWLENLSDEDIENMEDGGGAGSDSEESGGTNVKGFTASNGVDIGSELNKGRAVQTEELTPAAREALRKLFQKQQDFVDGNPPKGGMSREQVLRVDAMASTDVEQRTVGADGTFSSRGVTLTIVNRVTNNFLQQLGGMYGLTATPVYGRTELINDAINRGRLLARKLQVRNEERVLKTSRLNNGKIDKRLLHEVGFDNYDIFSKINIASYTPSYIHLSIDQSGSMSGSLIENALSVAAMFATASKYIQNIHLQVSIRSTVELGGKSLPYLVYIFDSKLDSIQTIRHIFSRVRAHGLTPEGLAFEGIQREIKMKSRNTDAYFINICDGEPYMNYDSSFYYSGYAAQEHCRKQMTRMEHEGVKFITYYIGSSSGFRPVEQCYGNNAHHLTSPHEVHSIARSMNKKLL